MSDTPPVPIPTPSVPAPISSDPTLDPNQIIPPVTDTTSTDPNTPQTSAETAIAAYLAGVQAAQSRYIGVANDYVATVQPSLPFGVGIGGAGGLGAGGTDVTTVAPRYLVGDSYALFAGQAASTIFYEQKALVNAGLVKASDISTPGTWGIKESKAMEKVMTVANRSGQSAEEVLAAMVQTYQAGQGIRSSVGSGTTAAPPVILSNPEDLRATFRAVAKRLTGGVFLSDTQINDMVKAYQATEAAAQRQGGATATRGVSAQQFAASQVQSQDPGGVAANRFAQMADAMTRLVGRT